MTSYEQQMLQGLQRIYNLLNGKLVPFIDGFNDFIVWIQDFLSEYSSFIVFMGFVILMILTLKWLSRW